MTHLSCPTDHGLVVMLLSLGAAFGLLAGKLLSDRERRRPPD